MEIVRRALRVPCMTIAKNAGVDGAVVVAKVEAQSGDYGYDALNNEYGSLFEKGIIDPTKVGFNLIRINAVVEHTFDSLCVV